MIKSFTTSQPGVLRILTKARSEALLINHITIDKKRSGKYDKVLIYFVDRDNRYLVHQVSAHDASVYQSFKTKLEGWQGAWIEVFVEGFGETFVMLEFDSIISSKKVDKCIDDTISYKIYTTKSKLIKT